MAKKKLIPIRVMIKKTKHATQPWKVSIDDESKGPAYDLKERYTRKESAIRGSLRKLNAQRSPVTKEWFVTNRNGDVRWIEFTVVFHKNK